MLTFWRKGYRGTSLDDLVATTGAPRASLYRVFGDKRAMLIASLERYGRQFDARVDEAMLAERSGRAAMRAILHGSADKLASGATPDGCLRCNSTLELAGLDHEIDVALDASNASYIGALRRIVDRAVTSGELSASDGEALPMYLTAVVNGMVTLARAGSTLSELRQVADRALSSWGRA